MKYTIDVARSGLKVCARSAIHDTNATWDRMSGSVTADGATIANTGAEASITVAMAQFDAGDWLKNRKLKSDMEVAKHPTATFQLGGLSDVTEKGDGSFSAIAEGVLRWRGREATVRADGSGRIDDNGISATAQFDLNVRDVGMKPPRFLMLKVEEVVTVIVTLVATPDR